MGWRHRDSARGGQSVPRGPAQGAKATNAASSHFPARAVPEQLRTPKAFGTCEEGGELCPPPRQTWRKDSIPGSFLIPAPRPAAGRIVCMVTTSPQTVPATSLSPGLPGDNPPFPPGVRRTQPDGVRAEHPTLTPEPGRELRVLPGKRRLRQTSEPLPVCKGSPEEIRGD